MSDYETIVYQQPAPGVARIVMNRPDARNAQNLQMTYDLNAAFDRAVQDDAIKVIVLAGADPHFSSGHDLRAMGKTQAGIDFPPINWWGGFNEPNAASHASRKSTCRSPAAGATSPSRPLPRCKAAASPAD